MKQTISGESEAAQKQAVSQEVKQSHSILLNYNDNNGGLMTHTYTNNSFKTWEFGTVNIRSGKEKDEGAKIYAIAKQAAKLKLSICCLQEVKYRNTGNKLIELDSGEKYEFHWCGMEKRREAGVGVLIKCDKDILISDPDVKDH